ncbi:MAG TPA: cyclic nucleotide-binding domain-containing protein, partial [Nitrospirae bacterium]|nr:cyclic nucleotide-binding domain-containing protein [Nitrospirota bacterium]
MAKRQLEKGKKLLRKIEFFKPFDDDEIEELLDISLVKKYGLNDVIIREDKDGYTFYVILSGAAKVVKEISPGKKVALAIFSEGDCFGEMA